ncbi:MAG: CDP-alcohol phosphatidyltransferase family protein [Candidatus Sungbacteria bacterium]|nr:CDP-alcohol phosphatidyltransferase family protein [Candidatus Sungbacteria bacterium]
MSVPNQLTLIRVLGVFPLFLLGWLAVQQLKTYQYWGVGVLCAAAFLVLFVLLLWTDYLDGLVARKYKEVTLFGKFFDPAADKLLILSAIMALAPLHISRVQFLFNMLLTVAGLLFFTALLAYLFPSGLGSALGSNRYGKVKVGIESALVAVLLFHEIYEWPDLAYIDGLWIFAIIGGVASLGGHWKPVFEKLLKKSALQ